MRKELISIDLLGKIYIKDVFLYYDEPVLFSCINSFNHHFLTVLIDYGVDEKIWLYLPISEARLIHAKKGLISLYDLFKNPEDVFLWKVYESYNTSKGKAVNIAANELLDEELPDKDSFIEWEEELVLINEKSDILEISKKERRDVFDISLEPNGGHSHEIDCEILGKSLKQIQSIIYQIANKNKSANSQVSEKIKRQNKLSVTETYAASFGVRLKSNSLTNLFGESMLQSNIAILMDLLSAKDNVDQVRELLKNFNPQVALKYRKLLKTLSKSETSIKAYCAFPNNFYRKAQLTNDDIKKSLSLIESEINNTTRIVEYDGKLVGANVVQKTFEFIPNDEDKISGVIAENVNVEEYRLPKYAHIKVEEQIELNEFTQREILRYKLLEMYYMYDNDSNSNEDYITKKEEK